MQEGPNPTTNPSEEEARAQAEAERAEMQQEIKGVREAFVESTKAYAKELESVETCLLDLKSVCEALQRERDPRATIERMMEILIQKDETWLREEGKNDSRVNFFALAMSELSSLRDLPDSSTVMRELNRQRRNESFINDVIRILPELTENVEDFTRRVATDLERARQEPSAAEGADIIADMDNMY